jgi:hypothetical protein
MYGIVNSASVIARKFLCTLLFLHVYEGDIHGLLIGGNPTFIEYVIIDIWPFTIMLCCHVGLMWCLFYTVLYICYYNAKGLVRPLGSPLLSFSWYRYSHTLSGCASLYAPSTSIQLTSRSSWGAVQLGCRRWYWVMIQTYCTSLLSGITVAQIG